MAGKPSNDLFLELREGDGIFLTVSIARANVSLAKACVVSFAFRKGQSRKDSGG